MKKMFAMLTALTLTAAIAVPFTVFADDSATPPADTVINPKSEKQTGDTTVSYNEQEMYIVTIPAKVKLADQDKTAKIKFSDVMLENGKKISVKLTDAANKELSQTSDFNVAHTNDVFATYTVTDGAETNPKTYALGDEVASFTYGTKDESGKIITEATETLTFTAPQGAQYAGTYTDTLTFGISVEDAGKKITIGDLELTYADGDTWDQIVAKNPDKIKIQYGSYIHRTDVSQRLMQGNSWAYHNYVIITSAIKQLALLFENLSKERCCVLS